MYTINLSDGVTFFNVFDLESNGPGNISTPRHILELDLTGGAGVNFIKIANDLTTRFVPGQLLNIVNSAGLLNDGIYTTVSSSFLIDRTTIILVEALTSASLPYGNITYSIPVAEEATSLLLTGKGGLNFGDALHENVIHLLENFASITPPANPILGQQWYDSAADVIKYYDGLIFKANTNIGSGIISFVDPQHPTVPALPTLNLTAADSDVGLSITVTTDPASGDSIFRVLSSGGSERLRVEHDGSLRTTNILDVQGTGLSTFAGNIQLPNAGQLNFPGGGLLTSDAVGNTLIIQSGLAGQAPLLIKNSLAVTTFQVRGDDNVEVINNLITPNITSSAALSIISTTGPILIQGGVGVKADVRFNDLDDSNYISLQSPDVVTTNRTWGLPVDDPAVVVGQFLTTDALGNLAFAIPAGGGGGINNVVEDLTPQLGNNLDVNGFVLGGDIDGTGAVIANSATVEVEDNATSGGIRLNGGFNSGSSSGGDIILTGGTNTASGGAGSILLSSGNASGVLDSGAITLQTGGITAGAGSTGTLRLTTGTNAGSGGVGSIILGTSQTDQIELNSTGLLRVINTTNYENLILADDDIPNKKWVDDTRFVESKVKRFFFSS